MTAQSDSTLKDEQRAALEEYLIRGGYDIHSAIRAHMFDKQIEVFEFFKQKKGRKAAVLTSRRAGKSTGAASILVDRGLDAPAVQSIYLALTGTSARYIMWPVMQALNAKLGMGAAEDNTKLVMTLPNGHFIRLAGADMSEDEKKKLLGQANLTIIIDECASWKPHIKPLIDDVLWPTLMDHQGIMLAVGAPGEIATGWFHEVTTKQPAGWGMFTWGTEDNPFMAAQYRADIEQFKAEDPDVESQPWFQRQYLGRWVYDTTALVYKFDPEKNFFHDLPAGEYKYLLTVDLGWDDPTAFCLAAYQKHLPVLFIIEAWKRKNMLLTEVAQYVEGYREKYKIGGVVIDNAAKQAVMEMESRFHIPFIAAEKHGKSDYIGTFNTDMRLGNILVRDEGCDELVSEWANLTWNPNAIPRVENSRCANHCADTALYCHRGSRHYRYSEYREAVKPGSVEWLDAEARRLQKQRERMVADERRADEDWWAR